MKHVKTKYIRGKCMYKYKGTLYFDQPAKTNIKKLLYKEDDNTTFAICKRIGVKTEVVCGLIILICVALSLFYDSYDREMIYYQNNIIWYNGILYLNLENSEASKYPITCSLMFNDEVITTKVLQPGEKWLTEKVEYKGEKVSLHVVYEYPLIKRYDTLPISVSIK